MKVNPNLQNNQTQPRPKFKIFNRWDVVTKGWYLAGKSSDLKNGMVKGVDVAGQHLAIFRTESGSLHALDGFCPHMGVDLGIGKVQGENLRCFFHHWKFDGEGKNVDIPCQKHTNPKARLTHYDVREKYGMIWVYPEEKAPYDVLNVPELEGMKIRTSLGKAYERSCHFHITMINGIDPQHLSTVHDIHMDMDIKIDSEEKDSIDIQLEGETPSKKLVERIVRFFLGDRYAYSMKYQGGCLASLSVMKGVKLFNKWSILPTLHMVFAYQSHEEGRTQVQPIYVTKKRNFLIDKFLLFVTRMAFYSLQGEDGEVYENIRFNTSNLLPMDAPVSKYINYVNNLSPSQWSRLEVKPVTKMRRPAEVTV